MKEQNKDELIFLSEFNELQIKELWENCFSRLDDLDYVNEFNPPNLQLPDNYDVINNFIKRNRTWLIQKNNDKLIIGYMIFGEFVPRQPDSIGLIIGKRFSGNGFGSKSISAICNILRNENHSSINGYCNEKNNAVIKIMEKNGFEKKGSFEFNGVITAHYEKLLSFPDV